MTKNNSNIHKQVRRESMVYSYNGLLLTNLKKTTDTHNRIDESHKHAEQKKPDTKEYM